ncbi:hypothetical protein D3C83_01130 [compost metagenome]
MEKSPRHVVVVERLVDGVARHYARERQVAAGDALGQQQKIRRDAGLLVGEETAGAAEAGHDLVGDQVHLVTVAERPRPPQVFRVVHRHAARPLHQRLDDQCRGLAVMPLEVLFESPRAAHGVVARRLPLLRQPPVGACHLAALHDERRIGVLEEGDVGHRQRAERLPVIAAGEADEAGLGRPSRVAPVMKAHLERDLDRGRAVARIEAMAERVAGGARKALRQRHRRFMAAPGKQDVLELPELVRDCGIDARMAVAEQVDPPRADGVEVATAVEIVEPAAFAASHRNERQPLVVLHLGAGVPDRGQAAL